MKITTKEINKQINPVVQNPKIGYSEGQYTSTALTILPQIFMNNYAE